MKLRYFFYIFALLLIVQLPVVANTVGSIVEVELVSETNSVQDSMEENSIFEVVTVFSSHDLELFLIGYNPSIFPRHISSRIYHPPITI